MIKQVFISFFLSISLVLIVGHAVIPHHHHSDVLLMQKTDHCPSAGSTTDHSDDLPFHCHAFNELNWIDTSDDNELSGNEIASTINTSFSEINLYLIKDNNFFATAFADVPVLEWHLHCQKGRRAPPVIS